MNQQLNTHKCSQTYIHTYLYATDVYLMALANFTRPFFTTLSFNLFLTCAHAVPAFELKVEFLPVFRTFTYIHTLSALVSCY